MTSHATSSIPWKINRYQNETWWNFLLKRVYIHWPCHKSVGPYSLATLRQFWYNFQYKRLLHLVVYLTMLCPLSQIVISSVKESIYILKKIFTGTQKSHSNLSGSSGFWSIGHNMVDFRQLSFLYSFAYNFLSLYNSPKWQHAVSGEPGALQYCVYYPVTI